MKLGFMQGRLSPIIDGKIQCFPEGYWEEEFPQAEQIGLGLMEWTLDQDGLHENPLMQEDQHEKIIALCEKHLVAIPSITGDCFMQAPFYKAENDNIRQALLDDLRAVITSASKLGSEIIVFPLVDNGSLETEDQTTDFLAGMADVTPLLRETNVKIAFECDYDASDLKALMEKMPADIFGVNYDTGNSAALGYNPEKEISAYGDRIINVHIKDRPLNGTTVPLGEGDTDFATVFKMLKQAGYDGNYIMQTARSQTNQHAEALQNYILFIKQY